jgi:hypothetical protein
MGRAFLSLAYGGSPVVVPHTLAQPDGSDESSRYPAPKKWSLSDPFDPDAEEFFIREDAVFEAFIPDDAAKPPVDLPVSPARVVFVGNPADASPPSSRSSSATPSPDLGNTMRAAGWEMVMPQLPVSSHPTTIPMADQTGRNPTRQHSLVTPDTPIAIPVASDPTSATMHALRAPAIRPANLPPFGARVRDSTVFGRILRAATAQAGADGTAIPPELLVAQRNSNEPPLVPFTPPTTLAPNPASFPTDVHQAATLPSFNLGPPVDERVMRIWRSVIQTPEPAETQQDTIPPPSVVDTIPSGYAPLR